MKIAIVDTGVDISHDALKNVRRIAGLTIEQNEDLTLTIIENQFEDEVGHGTSILGIILEHTQSFDAYIIKLKGRNGVFTETLIEEGIYRAIQTEDVKIINISMGVITDAPSEKLRKLCEAAAAKGIFIVASANSDTTKPCYPAYFEHVFGVGKGYFVRQDQFQYIPANKINILAKGSHQQIAVLNNGYTFSNGTSFATAHFTGILCNLIQTGNLVSRESVLQAVVCASSQPIIDVPLNYTKAEEVLSMEAPSNRTFEFYASVDPEIRNVALFPVNSPEFKPLVKYREIFSKKIVVGIDFPTTQAPAKFATDLFINWIPSSRELALFDTIVICDITNEYGIDSFKHEMLRSFIESDKHIITWNYPIYKIINQIIQKEHPAYRGKIYFPYYSETFMKESYLNLSLPPSETIPSLPIIKMQPDDEGIIYQHIISQLLHKKGYDVSNIAVDPQAILFGDIDILFPFTTKRMVDLEWEKWEIFLRLAKRLIAHKKKPDIFISGLGEMMLDRNAASEDEDTLNVLLTNTIFMKGISPDAYIGIVNSVDDLETINKTNVFIKEVFNIEPVCFVTNNEALQTRKFLKLSARKKYHLVQLSETKKIVNLIEKRFSN